MIEKIKRIPFWLQIVLILFAGAAVSAFIFLSARQSREKKRIEVMPKYTVTFAYQDGTVIDKKEVREGLGTSPPQLETNGIFRGWSSRINRITSDMEVHPMIYTPVEDNLFYFDTVYVKEGSDFQIELYVTGNVNFVDCDLDLEFDPDVMNYRFSVCESACDIHESDDGTLSISISSENRIRQKTKLATIMFHAEEKDVFCSEITLRSKGAFIYSDSGEKKPVDSATINNQIYFLQEVQ